jgi:hypothetical protein
MVVCQNALHRFFIYQCPPPQHEPGNDGITDHALGMITQANGWYLQLWAGVDKLEASTVQGNRLMPEVFSLFSIAILPHVVSQLFRKPVV